MANQPKALSPEEADYLEWRDELRADPEYEAIYKAEAAKGELWLNTAETQEKAKPASAQKPKRTGLSQPKESSNNNVYTTHSLSGHAQNSLSKGRDRTVYQREDHKWVNKRNDAEKATSVHSTQKDAVKHARQNLKNQGGGELIIKGQDGKIRSKDTVTAGSDPNPPKDTKH